jgi:Flp pilus assembly pilin Flp
MKDRMGVEWGRVLRAWGDAVRRHAADDRGASLVEYVMLLAFIVVVAVVAVGYVGVPVSEGLSSGGDSFTP